MPQGPKGRWPNYWCHISQPTNNIDILADLPEEFTYTAMSHYEGPTGTVSNGLANIAGSVPVVGALAQEVLSAGAGVTGGDVAFQYMTKRIWRGSEPIQFPLRLLFDAENNTYADVHEALTLLASIALPGGTAGEEMMYAPNPYRNFTGLGDQNKLAIRIGRQYYWDNCIVMSATPAVNLNLDEVGYPIAGAIDLQCCTDLVLHKQDLFKVAGVRSMGDGRLPGRLGGAGERPALSPVRFQRQNRGEE